MKPGTRLQSAVFHLTPTRTRCDLVIFAHGRTEKIASGLINPFLAHLKSAHDQFSKGGYSILLKPEFSTDPGSWFTKDTVERFVRFVSTPAVLERVHNLESEILQIEKAITIQSQNDIESSKVGNAYSKPVESIQESVEKDKGSIQNANVEKAIVLYEPSALANEETTSLSEENSKVKLVKVLKARKSLLQKEQKMAFARALAAGFDIDHMAPLISFAECFIASRLMDACTRFVAVWKTKHDTGQWLETEGADAASRQFDYATMMASGIMLSSVAGKEMNSAEAWPESAVESGQTGNVEHNTEATSGVDNNSSQQTPVGSQNHIHGQFLHPVYPPWGMHSSPGTLPVFQAYPIPGIPYYQSCHGHGPFIHPPYQSPEDVESALHKKRIQRRHLETNGISQESEKWGMDDAESKSHCDSDLDKETSDSKGLHKKTRSSKKNPGTIVIRNINYITAKKHNASGSESTSNTDDESEKDAGDSSRTRSTARQRRYTESVDLKSSMNGQFDEKVSSGGHWHAFQNCLLRSAEKNGDADQGMFSMEKEAKLKPRSIDMGNDPLADGAQYLSAPEVSPSFNTSIDTRGMQKTSNDELLRTSIGNYGDHGRYKDGSNFVQVTERDSSGLLHRTVNDEFMLRQQSTLSNYAISYSDLFSVNTSTDATQNVTDDSLILPSRLAAPHEDGTIKRDAIDMNYELPAPLLKTENCRIRSQQIYEPEDLGWIAERGIEQEPTGYNPALNYEMEVNFNKRAPGNSRKKDTVSNIGPNKNDNSQKPKSASGIFDNKRNLGLIKRGKPSKMSPIEEARARAEKLRSFKADLQKQKKEKEEEQKKRIEALKLERQKRITARSNVAPTKSVQPSPQARKQLLTKASPGPLRGSKFSDSEPGFSSPLQGVSRRTLSLPSSDTHKASKPKSNDATPSSGNKIRKSMSSLSELKTGEIIITTEPKVSTARIRRLSEPRSGAHRNSSAKRLQRQSTPDAITNASASPESKKISAIIYLDKTKAATLPELKIRIPDSDSHTDVTFEKSAVNKVIDDGNQPIATHSSVISEVETNNVVVQQNRDENSVVEKSVLILECEKSSIVSEHASSEVTGIQEYDHHSERATINVSKECRANQLKVRFDAHEVMKFTTEKDLSESSVNATAKPYQASHARVSSLEDSCTGNSEYGKASPTTSNMVTSFSAEATEVLAVKLSQVNLKSVPEILEKPRSKEPSKGGFKRLLKFGKKNTLSGQNTGLEANHYAANDVSSSQAPTLKNLISHDDTNTSSTPPPKSSRHFSLLSPFRKSAEKKIVIL